jgi:hypothetical protein
MGIPAFDAQTTLADDVILDRQGANQPVIQHLQV